MFPNTSRDKLVTSLSAFTCCTLSSQLMAVHYGMDMLTSGYKLFLIPAASSLTEDFSCTSWVIVLLASLAASWWITWCLYSCCVPGSDVLDEVPIDRHALDPSPPG
jgi:hypothetical protein